MKKNKNILSTIVCLILVFGCSFYVNAQSKSYSYDNVGNRVLRHLTVCPTCRTVQNEPSAATKSTDTTKILAVQHGLNVFPNPTQDKVVLSLSNLKDGETTSLTLSDETGKILYTSQNLQEQNEVNMSSYNNGTYIMRVIVGKDVMVYKIMKVQ
jgi:hypothetical protein